MSEPWKAGWIRLGQHWEHEWRRWMPLLIVGSLWVWGVLLAVPAAAPFVYLEIQPINDPLVALTFHREVAALVADWPRLTLAYFGLGLVAAVIGRRILHRWAPPQGSRFFKATMGLGATLTIAVLTMGIFKAPIGMAHHPWIPTLAEDVLGLAIIGIAVPELFWRSVYLANPGRAVARTREYWFVPWAWLLGLALSQMFTAAVSWTIATWFGTLVFGVLALTNTALFASFAYIYAQAATDAPPHESEAVTRPVTI